MSIASFVVDRADMTEGSRVRRQDRTAELFDEHYDRLRQLAYVILGDEGMAEEIVSEAFLKTFTGWSRIRDLDRADAYLRRAVVNLCRSRIRRKVIEARVNATHARREELKPPAWDPSKHEDARALWAAVRQLPPRQRACIVLHYVEDLPESGIAEALDCSVGTVRSQLSRARRKLARYLEEAGWTAGA